MDPSSRMTKKARIEPEEFQAPPSEPRACSFFQSYHSACYDAYMTGYIFASQVQSEQDILGSHKNRLYLMSKPRPLLIEKSRFAKMSQGHLQKKTRMV